MRAQISPHRFSGTIRIPASKSHTIRQLLIASLAKGVSTIQYPLDSLDIQSCAAACRAFGALITEHHTTAEDGTRLAAYTVHGNNGFGLERKGGVSIDVGNSGTTLYLAMAAAGLGTEEYTFTGDEQMQRRSAGPLLEALSALGVHAESIKSNGCVPITIRGPWKSGKLSLPCPTSQYLSALLLAAPLARAGTLTEITVPLLNEKPYVEMTLSYLESQGISCPGIPWKSSNLSHFIIPGGASWKPFTRSVPGDFSSAAFPACAAAISGGQVTILGLDPHDLQGDKYFLEILAAMGCDIHWEKNIPGIANGDAAEYRLTVSRSGPLRGGTFDLNETPDLLPAAAVTAAFAHGDTALTNVAHARIKETDRIAVMAAELAKLGVNCTEMQDGMIIHGSAGMAGGLIDGHGDHRIVMAFAAAALGAQAPIVIESAESAAITYPGFLDLLRAEYM